MWIKYCVYINIYIFSWKKLFLWSVEYKNSYKKEVSFQRKRYFVVITASTFSQNK